MANHWLEAEISKEFRTVYEHPHWYVESEAYMSSDSKKPLRLSHLDNIGLVWTQADSKCVLKFDTETDAERTAMMQIREQREWERLFDAEWLE